MGQESLGPGKLAVFLRRGITNCYKLCQCLKPVTFQQQTLPEENFSEDKFTDKSKLYLKLQF